MSLKAAVKEAREASVALAGKLYTHGTSAGCPLEGGTWIWRAPKERIVFDEGVYYGDEGTANISIEDITSLRRHHRGRGS